MTNAAGNRATNRKANDDRVSLLSRTPHFQEHSHSQELSDLTAMRSLSLVTNTYIDNLTHGTQLDNISLSLSLTPLVYSSAPPAQELACVRVASLSGTVHCERPRSFLDKRKPQFQDANTSCCPFIFKCIPKLYFPRTFAQTKCPGVPRMQLCTRFRVFNIISSPW